MLGRAFRSRPRVRGRGQRCRHELQPLMTRDGRLLHERCIRCGEAQPVAEAPRQPVLRESRQHAPMPDLAERLAAWVWQDEPAPVHAQPRLLRRPPAPELPRATGAWGSESAGRAAAG